jgi:anti-sigma-K factor RskA
MRYDDRNLMSLLAGEYVLGTLTRPARRRFDALLATRPTARALHGQREERLAALDLGIAPVAPPERVWERLAEQLGFATTRAPSGRWQLAFWRIATAALVVVAVALGVERMRHDPQVTSLEQQLAAHRDASRAHEQPVAQSQENAAKLREQLDAAQTSLAAPAYVSLVAEPGGKPLWLVKLSERTLRVTAVGAAKTQAGKSYELWMLPEGGNPVSLGVLPERGDRSLVLNDAQFAALSRASAVAVSLEPEGGSPTGLPTGPVLYSAPLLRG